MNDQELTIDSNIESSSNKLSILKENPIEKTQPQKYESMEFGGIPKNGEQASRLANTLARSTLVPDSFRNKPGDILVAMMMGAELGISPMQSLKSIAIIKGRPCIWGDAMLAIVKAHKDFEDMKETYDAENQSYTCEIKRRAQKSSHSYTFSMDEAKLAGISGRGVWLTYPKRMLQMRARGFAIRDAFPDALGGFKTREEVMDYPKEVEKVDENIDSNALIEKLKFDEES